MHQLVNKFRTLSAIGICASLLSGCLSDEVAETDPLPTTDVELSGSVGDGPVVGANLTVTSESGSVVAEFQSDDNASYNVTIQTDEASYPLMIEARGGTDLVTNSLPDFDMRGSMFESGNSSVVNVNPFSTFTVELARELPGGMSRQNLEDAQSIVSDRLNSGLFSSLQSGPMSTRIDSSNVAEIVKASETLAENVRRTRNILQAAGMSRSGNQIIVALGSDLTDQVIDGVGGSNTDARIAAVSTVASAQVLLESMANELRVNGVDATASMRTAIETVNDGTPSPTLDELTVTSQMIRRARVGLAAAYALDEDPEIRQLHMIVSDLQAGQRASLVRVALPADYPSILSNALNMIGVADSATVDLINAIARTNGDIDFGNLAPQIQGTPATSIAVGARYTFVPDATDVDGDVLAFNISNQPSWASFDVATGELTGIPAVSDIGTYPNIVISVTDGEFTATLPAFSITVNNANSPPTISGTPSTSVDVGASYSFSPTADDPDGDTLTFSVTNPPSWADFDSSTGVLSGIPSAGDVGTDSGIVISVSDGQASASLPTFSITVGSSNSAPIISGSPATSVNVDDNYVFTPSASDSDGDTLVFSVTGLPSWASFDPSNGRIDGTPQSGDVGVYANISIAVSDGQATASLAPFSITVQSISLGSVTLNWTAPTMNEDGSALTDLAGYRIYWGTSSGNYPNSVTINNASVLTHVVDNLSPGTYYFVATSFNTGDEESRYSGVATKVVP